jgi:hypothetical protein
MLSYVPSFDKVPAGSSTIEINFHAPLDIEVRGNNAVSVSRGPLTFAVDLSYNLTSAAGLRLDFLFTYPYLYLYCADTHIFFRSAQALSDVKNLYPNAPSQYLTPVSSMSFSRPNYTDWG